MILIDFGLYISINFFVWNSYLQHLYYLNMMSFRKEFLKINEDENLDEVAKYVHFLTNYKKEEHPEINGYNIQALLNVLEPFEIYNLAEKLEDKFKLDESSEEIFKLLKKVISKTINLENKRNEINKKIFKIENNNSVKTKKNIDIELTELKMVKKSIDIEIEQKRQNALNDLKKNIPSVLDSLDKETDLNKILDETFKEIK